MMSRSSPSRIQNTAGLGVPVARQSRLTGALPPTGRVSLAWGRTEMTGRSLTLRVASALMRPMTLLEPIV